MTTGRESTTLGGAVDRRRVLRGMAVGGAAIWVPPVIDSIASGAAAASAPPGGGTKGGGGFNGNPNPGGNPPNAGPFNGGTTNGGTTNGGTTNGGTTSGDQGVPPQSPSQLVVQPASPRVVSQLPLTGGGNQAQAGAPAAQSVPAGGVVTGRSATLAATGGDVRGPAAVAAGLLAGGAALVRAGPRAAPGAADDEPHPGGA